MEWVNNIYTHSIEIHFINKCEIFIQYYNDDNTFLGNNL